MSIKLTLDTLTIDGTTKFFVVEGSANNLVAVSDASGNIGYSTVTLAAGDESYPVNTSINTGSDSFNVPILKNQTYFVKADFNYTPSSEALLFPENNLQTNNIGDKVRIFALTTGGNYAAITGLTYPGLTIGKWMVISIADVGGCVVNENYVTGGVDLTSATLMDSALTEFTLLWSPLGMCKNGVRLTLTYPTSGPNMRTYTSSDYVWYRTKMIPNKMGLHLSTGTPPAPSPPIDPGGGGGGGGGYGGGGYGGGGFGGGGTGF